MNHIERIHAVMAGRPVDRLPRIEWAAWWDTTFDRWKTQGLPAELDNESAQTHFGLDVWHRLWIRALSPGAPRPAYHGGPVIDDAAGYDRLLESGQVFADADRIIDHAMLERLAELQRRQDAGELLVWLSFDGFFWMPRTLLGIEAHLYAFYDQPELMHRMNADNVAYQLALMDRLSNVLAPAFVCICEDMSYNHGPMLSQTQFDEFLKPYYQQVIAGYRKHFRVVTFIDSDGDVTTMVPWLLDAGIDGVLPLERQAGVDVALLRERHPEFCMIGAFDKMTMTQGEAAMRDEFERLLPVMRSGRFIPSVDHQTPPGVSLEQYRVYVRLLHEYCDRAGM